MAIRITYRPIINMAMASPIYRPFYQFGTMAKNMSLVNRVLHTPQPIQCNYVANRTFSNYFKDIRYFIFNRTNSKKDATDSTDDTDISVTNSAMHAGIPPMQGYRPLPGPSSMPSNPISGGSQNSAESAFTYITKYIRTSFVYTSIMYHLRPGFGINMRNYIYMRNINRYNVLYEHEAMFLHDLHLVSDLSYFESDIGRVISEISLERKKVLIDIMHREISNISACLGQVGNSCNSGERIEPNYFLIGTTTSITWLCVMLGPGGEFYLVLTPLAVIMVNDIVENYYVRKPLSSKHIYDYIMIKDNFARAMNLLIQQDSRLITHMHVSGYL